MKPDGARDNKDYRFQPYYILMQELHRINVMPVPLQVCKVGGMTSPRNWIARFGIDRPRRRAVPEKDRAGTNISDPPALEAFNPANVSTRWTR